jgi:hypothetical protein
MTYASAGSPPFEKSKALKVVRVISYTLNLPGYQNRSKALRERAHFLSEWLHALSEPDSVFIAMTGCGQLYNWQNTQAQNLVKA